MDAAAPPAVLIAAADRALASGRTAEAIERYRAALASDPRHPDAWFNLAWAHRATLAFEAAAAAYGEALARGVAAPEEAHLNRAAILLDHLDRGADARADLERAVALRPDFVPAWLSLGVVAEDEGDGAAATRAYRRALALSPGNGRAHARLGAMLIAGGDAAGAVGALRAALDGAAGASDRREILFVLGNALDGRGEHDQAFAAYRAANAMARDEAAVRYDPRGFEALVDRLIAAPPPPPLVGDGAASPIFVGGMFRSGSTLAERLLARHPALASGGERSAIPALVAAMPRYPAEVSEAGAPRLAEWVGRYRASLPGGGRLIDKRCDNYLHVALIGRMFPAGRLVHTHREPLDNLMSIYALDFGPAVTYGHDLLEAAHHYAQYVRLMRHWREVAADRIVELDYDRLVRAPGPVLSAVVASLGLADAGDLSAFGDVAVPVRTASAWQVRRPVNDRSSGRWRHYARHLSDARRLLAAAGVPAGLA